MKALIGRFAVILTMLCVSMGAFADSKGHQQVQQLTQQERIEFFQDLRTWWQQRLQAIREARAERREAATPAAVSVPELNAAGLVPAFTSVLVGLMLMAERRSRRSQATIA